LPYLRADFTMDHFGDVNEMILDAVSAIFFKPIEFG
jgi:hypothetical protein